LAVWVFDDPTDGLVHKPIVAGIDTMIERLVVSIPNGVVNDLTAHPHD
jgi:hypothetical protein